VGALVALKLARTPFSVSSVLCLLALLGVSVGRQLSTGIGSDTQWPFAIVIVSGLIFRAG
jgi:multidrug efflux pump subunit AcrB